MNRLTTVSWTEPEWSDPDNIVSIESNFRNGDVFYWGDFHVVYTAQDKAGNVGRCEFDVFIAPNECKIPDYARYSGDNGTMTLTNTLASKVGSYYAASVTCTDPRFPLPGPQLYTCDVMGQWHRSVSAPAITLPVCGVTDDPIQIISGYVIYDDTVNCTERHDMILNAMEGVLNGIPSSECVGTHTPEDGCYTLTMTTCADLGILTFDDEFFIDEDEAKMRFNFTIEIKSPNIDLNGEIFNAILILLDWTHSSVDTYPTEFACSSAYPVHMREDYNEYCTQTSPGNYNNNGTMEPCPSGTYSTDVNANSCTKCAGNYTTMYQGATSEKDCYVTCPKGFYTTFANRDACIPCQIGTYEDEEGGLDQCLSCNGNSTMRTASTSQADCVNTCDKLGQEMDENGNCVPCPQGWYKADISHLRCDEQCPYGLSTDGDGAVSKNSCTQLYCPPNRTPSTDTTLTPPNPSSFNLDTYCPLCSRGFAQPAANQTTCVACITINDISPFSSCASECEGTEDQKSCKDGYHCALIFQSPGYYECTKYASAPDADNNGVRWWLIGLIAVGVVIVAVLIVILVWCIFKRTPLSLSAEGKDHAGRGNSRSREKSDRGDHAGG
ncbi:hypothetical protein PRIPAC_93078 [Pristionchus pacificus]|nr:hypothetical protein PRIPAC_93078 [Pristionchus pacificus]